MRERERERERERWKAAIGMVKGQWSVEVVNNEKY
jgi:hypothetical protein